MIRYDCHTYCPDCGLEARSNFETCARCGENDIRGPFYWKAYKNGRVVILQGKPKPPFIEEYTTEVEFQHRWHFLTHHLAGAIGRKCDFESRCGYDRGPKFNAIIKRMMEV